MRALANRKYPLQIAKPTVCGTPVEFLVAGGRRLVTGSHLLVYGCGAACLPDLGSRLRGKLLLTIVVTTLNRSTCFFTLATLEGAEEISLVDAHSPILDARDDDLAPDFPRQRGWFCLMDGFAKRACVSAGIHNHRHEERFPT